MLTIRIVAFALRLFFASDIDAQLAVNKLPEACRPYATIPVTTRDDTFGWNQLLSLGSCLQDTTITPVTDEAELRPMVDRYHDALYLPMLIYVGVLENAPGPVQLHAAYQVGMAHLMMVVRARRSVSSPALEAKLEPMLEPSLRIARLTFAVIDRVVDQNPAFVTDEVGRAEVRSARALLRVLNSPTEMPPAPDTLRASRH